MDAARCLMGRGAVTGLIGSSATSGDASASASIERIAARLASTSRIGDRGASSGAASPQIERAKAARRPFTRAGTYAKRFAAKEAFSKAVGTGFYRGVYMKDIGVVNAALRRADAGADRRRGQAACGNGPGRP